jgi:sugar lactone lactonase YvrE
VVDSDNNRILGFYGYRAPRPDGTFPRADIVIGQPSLWDHSSANGDSSRYLPPNDRTLALIPFPYQISTAEGGRSTFLATDAQGNLYVPDLNNNRILKFNDPFASDTVADDVWGQTSFTNRTRLRPPTASSLFLEWAEEQIFTAGVDVDSNGNIWVADCGNSRVLRFPPGSKTANLVLGQSSFTTWNVGYGLNQMRKPNAVRVHPVTGELFVLDGETSGECRMLVFRPPFSTGMSAVRQFGKALAGNQSSGLHWARGFTLDPSTTNLVWVADGGNNRILKFDSATGGMLDVIGFSSVSQASGLGQYLSYNGTVENLQQPDGDIGLDAMGNLYFTTTYMDNRVRRVPLPLQRNSQGIVKADGQMLKAGWNQMDGRTVQDQYGMALAGGQLYCRGKEFQLLVWTNAPRAHAFQSADFVVGQSSLDVNEYGGTWQSDPILCLATGGGWLFAGAPAHIFVLRTPITSGGRDYSPYKVLPTYDGGSEVKWDDDGTTVAFRTAGLAYDAAQNVIWVSDSANNRVLRVRDPVGSDPRVDLVIGQTSKVASAQNHGRGLYSPDGKGFAAPWSLALDRFGNLYVVDSGFEGGGNMRALRFDAASLAPVPGNLFPDPTASGVFCKPDLTTNRDWNANGAANTPTCLAFDSQNRMILLAESYFNLQYHRAYYYPTPHLGSAPQPTHTLTNAFGQAAVAVFDGQDNLLIQDHTWNRTHFYTASTNAPLVQITNRIAMVPVGAASVTLRGTSSAKVVGTINWKTSGGLSGSVPANPSWSVEVPLAGAEVTIVNISGTNNAGFLGSDAISIARPVLPAPVIVPPGGTFTSLVTVALANFAVGAEQRFTLDGSQPTAVSTLYTGPFELTSNATVWAKSFAVGQTASEVAFAQFEVFVAEPFVLPSSGSVTGLVLVSMSCATPFAQICYTLDGSEPTSGGHIYTGPFMVDAPISIKARAFRPGAHPSSTAVANLTNTLPQVNSPSISPPGGLFTNRVTVAISSTTPGAEIRFSTDGTEPTRYSALYTGGIIISNSTGVKARAFLASMAPSSVVAANFALISSWQGLAIPGSGGRDRHVALGSDGESLYFTRGNIANAPFYRLPKGAVSGWSTLSSLPTPASMDGGAGVGDMAYLDGALWTLARFDDAHPDRCVYRYDVVGNTWSKGAMLSDGGANGGIAPLSSNKIYGGWLGWDQIRLISNWQAGSSASAGNLSGGAAVGWDACVGPEYVYFIKHYNVATHSGVLARLARSGQPLLEEIAGMPFNVGDGAAIEYVPAWFLADAHDRLYVLRGGLGTSDGDGGDWIGLCTTNQLAIYDLVSQTWTTETFPFAVDYGSEMCLVGDTIYILAATAVTQPLKMAKFQAVAGPPPSPKLEAFVTGGTAKIVWASTSRNWILEASRGLTPPVSWAFVTTGTNQYNLPIEFTTGAYFYRLRMP